MNAHAVDTPPAQADDPETAIQIGLAVAYRLAALFG